MIKTPFHTDIIYFGNDELMVKDKMLCNGRSKNEGGFIIHNLLIVHLKDDQLSY